MTVVAIDPGTTESGWIVLKDGVIVGAEIVPNADVLGMLKAHHWADTLAIEMIASYGMAVGKEVFQTCVWIGRFLQSWRDPDSVILIPRADVKMHLCKSMKAKDANIRQALLDKLGPPGAKKSPGPTYGVKSHAWAALAVAVTVAETRL